jgi:hypothetical protein
MPRHFLLATLLDRERAAIGDDERGVPAADRAASTSAEGLRAARLC